MLHKHNEESILIYDLQTILYAWGYINQNHPLL